MSHQRKHQRKTAHQHESRRHRWGQSMWADFSAVVCILVDHVLPAVFWRLNTPLQAWLERSGIKERFTVLLLEVKPRAFAVSNATRVSWERFDEPSIVRKTGVTLDQWSNTHLRDAEAQPASVVCADDDIPPQLEEEWLERKGL